MSRRSASAAGVLIDVSATDGWSGKNRLWNPGSANPGSGYLSIYPDQPSVFMILRSPVPGEGLIMRSDSRRNSSSPLPRFLPCSFQTSSYPNPLHMTLVNLVIGQSDPLLA